MVRFNLNDYVLIQLNDKGIELLREYYNSDPEIYKSDSEPGYYKFQFWEFIDIFGKEMSIGSYPPYSMEVLLYEKDLVFEEEK